MRSNGLLETALTANPYGNSPNDRSNRIDENSQSSRNIRLRGRYFPSGILAGVVDRVGELLSFRRVPGDGILWLLHGWAFDFPTNGPGPDH